MPNHLAVKAANTFLNRFGQEGQIDHLKLQKLLYFAYGWWLALAPQQGPLTNVKPQVWKLGPVFQPVYGAFAGFKDRPIPPSSIQPISPFASPEYIEKSDAYDSRIIDWIWSRYGNFSGTRLSNMTHEPGTPWYNIAQRHNFVVPKFLEMDDDENRAYFHKLGKSEGFIQ